MTREEQIEKVQKVLNLTSKNNNEHEVEAALLTAQKLMAKWHLTMADVADSNPDEAKEEPIMRQHAHDISCARPWVRILAGVVAKNFRCVTYINSSRGKHWCVFVGYETDVTVACDVFRAAFTFAERVSSNHAQLANDRGMSCSGIKVSYCNGFVRGLEEAYREQVRADASLALMVIVPEKAKAVLDGMGSFEAGIRQEYDRDEHYFAGKQKGYEYGSRKQLEG